MTSGDYTTDLVQVYDMRLRKWFKLKARLPAPRSSFFMGVAGTTIYVLGGNGPLVDMTNNGDRYVATAFALDTAARPRVWRELPPAPVAHGHFFVRDGDYFHSVLIRPGTPLSFHIPTETWTMASSPNDGAIPLFPLNYCGGSDPVVLYAP